MNQPEQTKFTSRNRRRRGRGGKPVFHDKTDHGFIAAKKNDIPLSSQKPDLKLKVLSWGEKNTYPYFLNYLFKNNPIHAGIIRSKVIYTTAGKLQYEGPDLQAWETFYNNAKKYYSDKNLDGVAETASLHQEKSNMFVMKVILSRLSSTPTLRKIKNIPFEKVRFEVCKNEITGEVDLTGRIAVSNDWTDNKVPIQWLCPYNPKDPTQRIFFVLHMEDSGQCVDKPNAKEINPGIYPDPPYGGAISDIETGIQIAKFNNSESHNSFSLGTLLNLNNGKFKNDDDKKKFERDVEAAATGAEQAGRMLVIYNNGKDREATVVPLNGNNLPERYLNVKKGTEDSIAHGHSVVAPVLFGIKHEGSLGNASELQNGYAIMQSNYFEFRRNSILSVLNWIGKTFAGLQGKITFGAVQLQLEAQVADDSKTASALNDMSPLLATKTLEVMTPNEIRALAKLAPLPGGDTLPVATPFTMTEEDEKKILKRLAEHGRSKKDVDELFSIGFHDSPLDEAEFKKEFVKSLFQTISDTQLQTLNLIQQGNDFNSIRQALDISGTELASVYKSLAASNMIDSKGKLMKAGVAEVVASDIDKLEVLYEYRLRPNAPELKPDGKQESRPFCTKLIELNRLYTRREIDLIAGAEGYDVFRYRGGWYHNWEENRNEPGCRHEWAQVVTFA